MWSNLCSKFTVQLHIRCLPTAKSLHSSLKLCLLWKTSCSFALITLPGIQMAQILIYFHGTIIFKVPLSNFYLQTLFNGESYDHAFWKGRRLTGISSMLKQRQFRKETVDSGLAIDLFTFKKRKTMQKLKTGMAWFLWLPQNILQHSTSLLHRFTSSKE